MNLEIQKTDQFNYIETGDSEEVLLLLHGLFGALSNFENIINHFGPKMNVAVPILPIFDMDLRELSLEALVKHVEDFVALKAYKKIHALGNSLGGHIALLFSFKNPDLLASLTLTGSSGLFENSFGNTFPQRENYEFIKTKTESTFYDPKIATKDLVDEVFEMVNNRSKAMAIVVTAKSALKNNVEEHLHKIKVPSLLIWGKDDTITPLFVAEKFDELIEDSSLEVYNKCGHAPMMEHPEKFNKSLFDFLSTIKVLE